LVTLDAPYVPILLILIHDPVIMSIKSRFLRIRLT